MGIDRPREEGKPIMLDRFNRYAAGNRIVVRARNRKVLSKFLLGTIVRATPQFVYVEMDVNGNIRKFKRD